MKRLGPIVRLQIQAASLKRGEKPHQWYDPSALREAQALSLDAKGAALEDGALDIHHMDHPQTKQVPGENALSLGTTGAYARMRARFGPRMAEGVAGENLIVDCGLDLRLEDLAGGLILRSRATGGELALGGARVAHPCRPFSLFALGREAEADELKEALRFLDGGTRGFYVAAESRAPFLARIGDEVFLR